jgi:hypothetical protein
MATLAATYSKQIKNENWHKNSNQIAKITKFLEQLGDFNRQGVLYCH